MEVQKGHNLLEAHKGGPQPPQGPQGPQPYVGPQGPHSDSSFYPNDSDHSQNDPNQNYSNQNGSNPNQNDSNPKQNSGPMGFKTDTDALTRYLYIYKKKRGAVYMYQTKIKFMKNPPEKS
jgi:hypothetical protein